ncbi:hypothetical protein QBC34DRAFT_408362 [Podospora aff. communis PSN243]|uniref:Secreted protein n=1 Tax=Podospora aff. communis PSN243 TaxID=3040156 RepID=A0AAV9GKJ3_9PEZI|nr:hypothetical protein QBC34DRAFT_408362 [Podospora aff. communis PSN243]
MRWEFLAGIVAWGIHKAASGWVVSPQSLLSVRRIHVTAKSCSSSTVSRVFPCENSTGNVSLYCINCGRNKLK